MTSCLIPTSDLPVAREEISLIASNRLPRSRLMARLALLVQHCLLDLLWVFQLSQPPQS